MLLKYKNIFSFCFSLTFYVLILANSSAYAQSGNGGTKSLFQGVGARALSLGNAFVALSDDPTAVFYNPAGLDLIERKSASFYFTNLGAGSSYSFIGGVYPTKSIGSFGFGWLRIGTGDIVERDEAVPDAGSTFDFSRQLLIISYSRQIRESIAAGLSIKFERVNFSLPNLSDSGIGFDFGVIYKPVFDNELFRDVSVGVNIQNLLKPKTKLIDASEATPLNFKVGLAKPIRIGEDLRAVTFLLDLNRSQNASTLYHFGAEYSVHELAKVRLGINNGLLAFGAGAIYNNFNFDYTFGKLFDGGGFSSNHRFSISVAFGKTKAELIRLAQEKRDREFRVQLESELWFARETEFNANMEEGREKYYDRDFLGAYVDFSSAADAAEGLVEIAMRTRGDKLDDPEMNMRVETANAGLLEAQNMLGLANAKSDSVRKQEIAQIARQETESKLEEDLRDFILQHKEKGGEFFKRSLFSKAIDEWQLALDRINQNQTNGDHLPDWVDEIKSQLQSNIQMAEQKLEGNIKDVISRADALARQGRFVQALDELSKIRGAATSEADLSTIDARIRSLRSQSSFQQNFAQGTRAYERKDWKAAMDAFEKALAARPGHKGANRYFKESKARALATAQELTTERRAKFLRGRLLVRQGKYDEAIKLWEELLEEQPYNKTILDAIDGAREQLENNK